MGINKRLFIGKMLIVELKYRPIRCGFCTSVKQAGKHVWKHFAPATQGETSLKAYQFTESRSNNNVVRSNEGEMAIIYAQ